MIKLSFQRKDETLTMEFKHDESIDYLMLKLQEFVSLIEGEPIELDYSYQWQKYNLVPKPKGRK